MGNWPIDSSVQSGNLSNSASDTENPMVKRCTDKVGFGKTVQRE